jgi:hypothetical protein
VLQALERGSFYSSTGPRIEDIAVESDSVTVECSPAASVALVTLRTLGARVNMGRMGFRSNGSILETTSTGEIAVARLERWSSWPTGRVEVTDAAGRRAWTNPLWFGA